MIVMFAICVLKVRRSNQLVTWHMTVSVSISICSISRLFFLCSNLEYGMRDYVLQERTRTMKVGPELKVRQNFPLLK